MRQCLTEDNLSQKKAGARAIADEHRLSGEGRALDAAGAQEGGRLRFQLSQTWIKPTILVVATCTIVLSLTVPSNAYPRPGLTLPLAISYLTNSPTITGDSIDPVISDNGRYVAFTSEAVDLAAEDKDPFTDVYRLDQVTGEIEVASIADSGAAGIPGAKAALLANIKSQSPSISANGRFVAFWSNAINLVPGDTNQRFDAFVRDLKRGRTYRVSVTSAGEQSSGEEVFFSGRPSLSANGRLVAFTDTATNLAEATPNGNNVFVHDRETGRTEIQSVVEGSQGSSSGAPAGGGGCGALSPDGSYVVFGSNEPAYLPENAPRPTAADIDGYGGEAGRSIIRNLSNGKTEVLLPPDPASASREYGGIDYRSAGSCGHNPISRDGRYLTFSSGSKLFVPNDANDHCSGGVPQGGVLDSADDVFVKDMKTGRVERVTVTSWGGQKSEASSVFNPSISPDGRYVIFVSKHRLDDARETSAVEDCLESRASATEIGSPMEVWVHDRLTGSTEKVSAAAGRSGYTWFWYADITPDGRYAVWDDVRPREEILGNILADHMVYWHDRGLATGATTGPSDGQSQASDPEICVETVCLPPDEALVVPGDVQEKLKLQMTDLIEARIAYRSQSNDLFVAEELAEMPALEQLMPGLVYGLRFNVGARSFEVRATSTAGGRFGLFECSSLGPCEETAQLRGGFGTTGMRIVFSLPSDEIGLNGGGEITNAEAYTALGSYYTGVTRILDRIRLK